MFPLKFNIHLLINHLISKYFEPLVVPGTAVGTEGGAVKGTGKKNPCLFTIAILVGETKNM